MWVYAVCMHVCECKFYINEFQMVLFFFFFFTFALFFPCFITNKHDFFFLLFFVCEFLKFNFSNFSSCNNFSVHYTNMVSDNIHHRHHVVPSNHVVHVVAVLFLVIISLKMALTDIVWVVHRSVMVDHCMHILRVIHLKGTKQRKTK